MRKIRARGILPAMEVFGMLAGAWLTWLGFNRLHRWSHPVPPPPPPPDTATKIAELEYRAAALDLQAIMAQTRERHQAAVQAAELAHEVAADAMRREARAKAALVGLLKAQGCDDESIEKVLLTIEEPERLHSS